MADGRRRACLASRAPQQFDPLAGAGWLCTDHISLHLPEGPPAFGLGFHHRRRHCGPYLDDAVGYSACIAQQFGSATVPRLRTIFLYALCCPCPISAVVRQPPGRYSPLAAHMARDRNRPWHSGADHRLRLRRRSPDGVSHRFRARLGRATLGFGGPPHAAYPRRISTRYARGRIPQRGIRRGTDHE